MVVCVVASPVALYAGHTQGDGDGTMGDTRRATKSAVGDSGATATQAAATAGAGGGRGRCLVSLRSPHTHPLFTTRAANFQTIYVLA